MPLPRLPLPRLLLALAVLAAGRPRAAAGGPGVERFPGVNAAASARALASTATLQLVGTAASLDACTALAAAWSNATAPRERCETATWLHSPPNATWAGACFCHTDHKWVPVPAPAQADSARLLWPCRDAADCSYNGECSPSGAGTRCLCGPGWQGPWCGSLRLLPVDRAALGYRHTDPATRRNVSSWGAAMLQDNQTGLWHGWASEMGDGCGIHSWQSNSQVVHITSPAPHGPYARAEVVWPAFAHEPDVVRGPAGEWVMVFSAYDLNATGACTNCTDGTTSPTTPKVGCAGRHKFRQMLAVAPGPAGPWNATEIPQLTAPWDWNTALVINPNRSAFALLRAGFTWFAADYAEPSTWVPLGPDKGVRLPDCGDSEDPFLWRDAAGRYHALLHNMDPRDPAFCGIHAFSADGVHWECGGRAYTNQVAFTDGTAFNFSRRERPHLLLGPNAEPLALSNGVQYGGPYGDGVFTLVQPIAAAPAPSYRQEDGQAPGSTQQWAATIANLTGARSDAAFHAVVRPLANATYLSYTATYGSYFHPADLNATITGWARVPALERNPAGGGLRALAFAQADSRRLLIAFRGTDLNASAPSGLADQCADALLWEGKPLAQLAPACRTDFPPATLDYLQGALAVARHAQSLYPGWGVLFTGHSLGAGLAALAAMAVPGTSAAVFSSPPMVDVAFARLGVAALRNNSAAAGRLVFMASQYDPVSHTAHGCNGLTGWDCLWDTAAVFPVICEACFRGRPCAIAVSGHPACEECFAKHHIFANYYNNLVPGPRPTCSPQPRAWPAFPKPTLLARAGSAPTIDGVIAPGEWDADATFLAHLAPMAVNQFSPAVSPADFSLVQAWVKFDEAALYFAFELQDDVAYSVDTTSWQPSGNPYAALLNRTGWPWFGDEMEIIVNARPQVSGHLNVSVVGNRSQWQMCVNRVKSRLGGYGVPGLMEGEPRSDNGTAWALYGAWIDDGVFRAATNSTGHARGYAVEWAIGWDAFHTRPGHPFSPGREGADVPIGFNLAFGDLDTAAEGDPRFGFHHEQWISGERNTRTWLSQLATLWLVH